MAERLKILVGMSGGVDSSVAALHLLEAGHDVRGLFMKNWEEDDNRDYCAALVDLEDAQAVSNKLGIPLHTVNFSHEYWERVFKRFLKEYETGLTPNPDILCNREIKFKEFLEHAVALGADAIATGHYAGIRKEAGGYVLLRGKDANKDQSYFLYTLGQHQLGRAMFPLAAMEKSWVRDEARRAGLGTSGKKDSTGICFIGERKFREFLSRYLKPNPGEIRDADERVLGEHNGLMYYTLGQRQGMGVGGAGEPWYVARKDLANNVLYIAQGHDHPALFSTWLTAGELSWVAETAPSLPFQCTAKTRYRQPNQNCTIESLDRGACVVRFRTPQWAVTPGQSIVFYEGEKCLGGGVIADCEALAISLVSAA
ncbi:MAG: tRNA-specific 2-thiouridylase MnmA [Gammaproteobacteria bacterium]|nr:tRNA-specific 2-thiouridylase MnmA [Gammaproteobacteria bacterium]